MAEIRVERLHKTFKDVVAVDDVSFAFADSEVTCLLGPSGCGKTTLMRMIAGLEQPTSGEVYFGDERITHMPPRKRNIGMVFQYPVVYRGISVYRNIELPLLGERLSREERARRVADVIDLLGLQESADLDMTRLDNGTRQKVAVAREVARQPRFILFDEPITNVDAAAKIHLKRAFKELTRRLRQTIVYVTHDQTEAMTLADQIALMKDGRIVQCAPPRVLYNEPADVFAGWFLGNPGMDFFPATLAPRDGALMLASPLFPTPVSVTGAAHEGVVTLGIRPEQIRVSAKRTPGAVTATVVCKSITIGRQYLVTLQTSDQRFKAKVEPALGHSLSGQVWVEVPLDQVVVFDPDGHRLTAFLHGVPEPAAALGAAP